MENRNRHHFPGVGNKGTRWENTGNEGNLPMIGHVVSLLSALVGIIGIISDNLGKRK